MINNALVTDAYTCVEGGSSGAHTLTISGSITSATAIENMVVGLQDVLNPVPALTTDTFVVKIGQDLSTNTTGAATLTLEKADLTSCSITFNPAAVNTTGDMEVYVGINNQIPKNGWLEVKFPPTLQWQHDISTNHQLPIGGTLTC
jgi:ethanolamine utilization microcompartment shell protein EutS